MPKSVTFTRPSSWTSTLLGFTSRWTRPRACAAASASATCARDVGGARRRQRAVQVDGLAQRRALDQLHHDVGDAVVLAGVVGGDDVGVGHRGRGHGLAAEAGAQRLVLGERRVEGLHRDRAGEQRVLAPPDRAPCRRVRSRRRAGSGRRGRARARRNEPRRRRYPSAWCRTRRSSARRGRAATRASTQPTPIVRGPACVPMTGPISPNSIWSRGTIVRDAFEELVDVGRLRVEHEHVAAGRSRPRASRPGGRGSCCGCAPCRPRRRRRRAPR